MFSLILLMPYLNRALSHKNFIWRKELETIDTKIIEKLLKNNVA